MQVFEFALAMFALIIVFKLIRLAIVHKNPPRREDPVNAELLERLNQVEERSGRQPVQEHLMCFQWALRYLSKGRRRPKQAGDRSHPCLLNRLRAVGPSAVSYNAFDDTCGVIPEEISDADVFPGGTIEGNVCWQVQSPDAASLVMYDDPLVSDTKVFLALR